MSTSPTQRSLAWAREQGYMAEVVERWNAWAKVRHDLFGIVDIVCVARGATLAIQATSYPNVSARVEKMRSSDALEVLKAAGWIVVVHGWKKPAKGQPWTLRSVEP